MESDNESKRNRPSLEKMRPFEWLYWAFIDAGMVREAEGMQAAIIALLDARSDAQWQATKREEVQHRHEALVSVLRDFLKLDSWTNEDAGSIRHGEPSEKAPPTGQFKKGDLVIFEGKHAQIEQVIEQGPVALLNLCQNNARIMVPLNECALYRRAGERTDDN